MGKRKRKLTPAEKQAKRERREKYMTIFVNGKQKRVPRPPTIDGTSVDEFIPRHADFLWLHQNELWHLIPMEEPLVESPLRETDDTERLAFYPECVGSTSRLAFHEHQHLG